MQKIRDGLNREGTIGFRSFAEGFRDRAASDPDRVAIRFCTSGGEEVVRYGELAADARALACWLADRSAPGDRVLLSFQRGTGFARAFLGCLWAGVVPVPVPARGSYARQEARIAGIAADCRAGLVLGDEEVEQVLAAGPLGAAPGGEDRMPPPVEPRTLAFLQYTSGSTTDPKGVMVSHGALVHNAELITTLQGWDSSMTWCSWLPIHHDMGLIAMLLTPLYLGGTIVLMSPTDFLKRPVSWLRLIDRYGAEISCAPDFAYDLCARKLTDEQIADLDLTRWRQASNGAEPIDPATLTRFAERFAPAGFQPRALTPAYGLAEATLCVSSALVDEPPSIRSFDAAALAAGSLGDPRKDSTTVELVGCGVVRGLDVRIVDPDSAQELPDGAIGEVWVRGGSIALGYWERPEETSRQFGAVTAAGEGGYLRTGDLGGRADGELFVTGRLKETINARGRNLYPHDIERELRSLEPAFAGLPSAAFSVPVGVREEIVVVQEVRARDLGDEGPAVLALRAKAALSARLGTRVGGLVLVRVGQVRRTTSGKVQRTLMRALFRTGEPVVLHAQLDPELHPALAPALVARQEADRA
ncbi:fatty acyl-AMP ligase [Streptomyces antarcticus]|uniref:fatty acyl-AMP ligase n=1 Tax=Streptomyces antarcticus TaxID=2996458 RepID=UPI002270680E|nr:MULTISPECIES: fatty acyl-AMP ligase [unclassified Streptomyces]MCY0947062.1 fatty acyl-AMP ligase [Streptomyces sp. H34-AA3]MCZ4084769.1 fatty acyl-AMP ligase [Streptomyces sp. H34-S5]